MLISTCCLVVFVGGARPGFLVSKWSPSKGFVLPDHGHDTASLFVEPSSSSSSSSPTSSSSSLLYLGLHPISQHLPCTETHANPSSNPLLSEHHPHPPCWTLTLLLPPSLSHSDGPMYYFGWLLYEDLRASYDVGCDMTGANGINQVRA
jgi:hypothetical protein